LREGLGKKRCRWSVWRVAIRITSGAADLLWSFDGVNGDVSIDSKSCHRSSRRHWRPPAQAGRVLESLFWRLPNSVAQARWIVILGLPASEQAPSSETTIDTRRRPDLDLRLEAKPQIRPSVMGNSLVYLGMPNSAIS